MQIIDQQQQRSVGGDVRRDPEQAIEDAEGDVGRGFSVVGRLEHSRCRLRGAGQQPCPLGGIHQEGIEQLPHDPERQLTLEVAAAGCERTESLCRLASRRQQPALPDPGWTLDQCQGGPALERVLYQVVEDTELAIALEQVAGRQRRSAGCILRRYRVSCSSEIAARISSATSGGTSSMPCTSRA